MASKFIAGKPTLYNNVGCPFAHRAWLTLVEKGVAFDIVEVPLSGQLKKFKEEGKTSGLWATKSVEECETIKADYKSKINATGEVPTLAVGGHIVTEAEVVAEFIDDNYKQGTALLPDCPLQRARTRHMIKVMSGNTGVSAFYGLLMNQDPSKDEEIMLKIYKHHAKFAELADDKGPFFLGSTVSFCDIMLAPFYYRFTATLNHYRGVAFIPPAAYAAWAPRLHAWARAMDALPSFKQTTVDAISPDQIIALYKSYAGARGVSKPL